MFDIGNKAPLIIAFRKIADRIYVRAHCILPDAGVTVGTRFP